jgi:two-component system, chemotaxis family, sensor kinase CheA
VNPAERARLELIDEFSRVARERLDKVSFSWLALERQPDDRALAEDLLRQMHTLKGEAKMMGFADLSLVAHRSESIIIAAQQRGFVVPDRFGDLLLAAVDTMGALLSKKAGTPDAGIDLSQLFDRIDSMSSELAADGSAAPRPERPSHPPGQPKPARVDPERFLRVGLEAVSFVADASMELLLGQTRFEHSLRSFRELQVEVEEALAARKAADRGQSGTMQYLSNRLTTLVRSLEDNVYENARRTGELDHRARQLRLVPISGLLNKYVRAAHDLSAALGKKVGAFVDDNGITIDKQVVDRLADPLLHLVRNGIDHGIESSAERQAAGKPPEGRIVLSAAQEAARVVIAVEDDGRGVDADEVRSRAVTLGMLSSDEAAKLSDDDALGLLFASGFSTRTVVSETSGRGIGLDVVRKQVESLGGVVRVRTKRGAGTRFELRVPISVLVTRMLVVECPPTRMAIPSVAVAGVTVESGEALEFADNRQVVRWRGSPVAIVDLASIIGVPSQSDGRQLSLVIIEHEGVRIALRVNGWCGEGEAISRPLDAFFASVKLFSGACTLPEGTVALVLNPSELVARALGDLPRIQTGALAEEKVAVSRRIVLAEDSAITRAMLARILASLGYDVREAANGRTALQLVEREGCDLLLTDLEMPEMDGIALIQALRGQSSTRHLPIIILSTRGSDEEKKRGLDAGADAYLVKTDFSEAALRRAIASQLGQA